MWIGALRKGDAGARHAALPAKAVYAADGQLVCPRIQTPLEWCIVVSRQDGARATPAPDSELMNRSRRISDRMDQSQPPIAGRADAQQVPCPGRRGGQLAVQALPRASIVGLQCKCVDHDVALDTQLHFHDGFPPVEARITNSGPPHPPPLPFAQEVTLRRDRIAPLSTADRSWDAAAASGRRAAPRAAPSKPTRGARHGGAARYR